MKQICYAFTLDNADRGSVFLGQYEDALEASQAHPGPGVSLVWGPEPWHTIRATNGNARMTYHPHRQALGSGETVRDCRPWHVAIRGEVVNHFATLDGAGAYLKAKGYTFDVVGQA